MGAPVLLNLSNELRKRDKMRGLPKTPDDLYNSETGRGIENYV